MNSKVSGISWWTDVVQSLRRTREIQDSQALKNPFLMQALAQEKREGQHIAAVARTVALGLISLLLPYLNPTPAVLYYEALLVLFVVLGWVQVRFSRVGRSGPELALIFADLALLAFVCMVPNPFAAEQTPTASVLRFGTFIYFFVFLAVATLAYSWRTIFSIGTWVAAIWLAGLSLVAFFGRVVPELSEKVNIAFADYPLLGQQMDPNSIEFHNRVQEVVVFLIVSAILALKSRRSNALLLTQATVAAERANLSRYFSPNMVETLASSNHDIGAVRTQDIAVLFSDIVGFTKIAENSSPETVMRLLRRYHSVLENAIFQHDGTLDKYLGDGVMATFGTPHVRPEDAANAINAARQIVSDMDRCSREGAAHGDPAFVVSVGVHFGPVILGDIGPARRMEFAVVGDTVNVASRLEALTRDLNCRVVCSDAVVRRAIESAVMKGDPTRHFHSVPGVSIRGRNAPIDVWTNAGVD